MSHGYVKSNINTKLTQKKDGDSNDGDGDGDGKREDVDRQSCFDKLGGDVTRCLAHQIPKFHVAEKLREQCVRLCHLHDTDLVLLTRMTKVDTGNFLFGSRHI